VLENFHSICVDEGGNVIEDTAVTDRNLVEKDRPPVICEEHAEKINHMIRQMKTEIAQLKAEGTNCANCGGAASGGAPGIGDFQEIVVEEAPACDASQKMDWFSEACVKQLACNAFRSMKSRCYFLLLLPALYSAMLTMTVQVTRGMTAFPLCCRSSQRLMEQC